MQNCDVNPVVHIWSMPQMLKGFKGCQAKWLCFKLYQTPEHKK